MAEPPTREQFLKLASEFFGELKQAQDFSEVLALWRSTSIPYAISQSDPHSSAYRKEVLDLYHDLTGCTYDVKNEWTSTLQSPDEFERGYPWVSANLAIIAEEIAKPIQILRALHELDRADIRVVEFGAGWGNLAIPLAKSGVAMTLVDIDQGFLDRAKRIAERDGLSVETICGDFLEIASQGNGSYDVAVFQSSFHHCLDFEDLLLAVRDRVLKPGGQIFFANEPISTDLKFPWGLRYDGESLWAIMCNKWLELGFHHDFFVQLLLRTGFLPQALPEVPTLVDRGWRAVSGLHPVPFASLRLPERCSATFHDPESATSGRFTRGVSTLPPVDGGDMNGWKLRFVNYALKPLQFRVGVQGVMQDVSLESGEDTVLSIMTHGRELVIDSATFVPSQDGSSLDERRLGVYIETAALF